MNKILRFRQSDKQKVYIVTDLHYNHDPKWPIPLWKARGYESRDEMNKDIVAKINATVGADDILINLGDISLNIDEAGFNAFLDSIVCQNMYLLWGNHNNPAWAIYKRKVNDWFASIGQGLMAPEIESAKNVSDADFLHEIYPFKYKNVTFVGNYLEVIIDGKYCVLQHFPLDIWNEMKNGAIHLCGHSHYNYPETRADYKDAKKLDCSWDGLKRPYAFNEIVQIMNTKSIPKLDHHQ